MTQFHTALLTLILAAPPALAGERLISHPCTGTPKSVIDRLEAVATARGLKIFARIDHAAGARSIGETLRPTELVILGHPKAGTPLLQCEQTLGLDLPMRVLAWETAEGECRIGYASADRLAQGHAQYQPIADKLIGTLDQLVKAAASPK